MAGRRVELRQRDSDLGRERHDGLGNAAMSRDWIAAFAAHHRAALQRSAIKRRQCRMADQE